MHDVLVRIPIPFTDAALPLHSYGVMAMLGFLAALMVARWRAKTVGISVDNITDVALCALLGGIVGSRIAYVIHNADVYLNPSAEGWSLLNLFKIWEGGLVFYGGFIGASLVTLVLLRVKKERILPILDVLAPSLALGHAFGRIGCLLRGCCYGIPLHEHSWCGIVYPNGALPYDPTAASAIPSGTPLFPVQILSAIGLLMIFGALSLYFRRRKGEGEVIGLYLVLYSVHRFLVEFLRGDTHQAGQISPAQWVSIFAFFGGLCVWVYVRSRIPTAPGKVVQHK